MDVNNNAYADKYLVDIKERYERILSRTIKVLENLSDMREDLERTRPTTAKDKGDFYELGFQTWRARCFMFLDNLDSLRKEVDACASLYASLTNTRCGTQSLRPYVHVQTYVVVTLMNRKDLEAAKQYIQIAKDLVCLSDQDTVLDIKKISRLISWKGMENGRRL